MKVSQQYLCWEVVLINSLCFGNFLWSFQHGHHAEAFCHPISSPSKRTVRSNRQRPLTGWRRRRISGTSTILTDQSITPSFYTSCKSSSLLPLSRRQNDEEQIDDGRLYYKSPSPYITTVKPATKSLNNSSNQGNQHRHNQRVNDGENNEMDDADERITPSASTKHKNNKKSGNDGDGDDQQIQNPQFRRRNRYWVVLVDDESSIRLSVGDFLFEEGYQVSACADAEALLALVKTPLQPDEFPKTPDVIISDIRMPGGKDGIALLNILRKDIRLQRVPVILLTAKSLTDDRIEGYRAGADLYLPKPFAPEELLAMVDNVIVRRSQMVQQGISGGKLVDMQQSMAAIKTLLRQNQQRVNRATAVFLTQSQRDTLELVGDGLTNAQVAQQLGVSRQRVMENMTDMMALTQTSNRTELVRWAIQTGYLSSKIKKKKEETEEQPNADGSSDSDHDNKRDDGGVQVWR